MKKLNHSLAVKVAGWIEKEARQYVGERCVRITHQPPVPKSLKKKP